MKWPAAAWFSLVQVITTYHHGMATWGSSSTPPLPCLRASPRPTLQLDVAKRLPHNPNVCLQDMSFKAFSVLLALTQQKWFEHIIYTERFLGHPSLKSLEIHVSVATWEIPGIYDIL